ncbi:hypothetical protein F4808DRAFT_443096 [Astrocystis sublimbata]|nr:hypothetical protein F4808DRAFT_443096 [Astrocystis sublimbata]
MPQNKNAKILQDNQAWRKKPRKWAPKSRLGCQTCKTRRVKCDLAHPSCLKCQSTGRTCDGYNTTHLPVSTDTELDHYRNGDDISSEGCDNPHDRTLFNACQPNQWHTSPHEPSLHNLRPFMILPATGPAQTEAISFFEYFSIKHLNEYHPCDSWRKTLMFFSQTVPAVRYAAVALSLTYQNYLNRGSTKIWPPEKTALLYYNRAIRLLLELGNGDSSETTAITLLVCYLFTCFDHLTGNFIQATKHLRGGVGLLRGIDRALLSNSMNDDVQPPQTLTVLHQVARQIRRLDLQATISLVDWTPVDIQDALTPQLPPSDITFSSLEHAADCLQVLIAEVMRLRNMGPLMCSEDQVPSSLLSLKDSVLARLETWSTLFENMLQQHDNSYESPPETHQLISLLRLQHTLVWTFLSSYGTGREMEYDRFLPQFQRCVTLADEVVTAHEQYLGSLKPTYTSDIGILPALYLVGAKCRHPVVRREVLRILRRQPIREAAWDSIATARVVERVIEVEEAGIEDMQSMDQIMSGNRVEILSWIHVINEQPPDRLDVTYTMCGRDGCQTESLMRS